ncbi:MAG: Jag N-terminal domain-containing protein [Desulfobacterales bacterium]|nr:Jag N-terminal domain-containing protein [Desulfobacterales bacterium]
MKPKKIEFQGKDVAEAIKNACRTLNVSQEDLDIEVLNTGSLGIFGLCRQKVRLRVSIKQGTAARKEEEARESPLAALAAEGFGLAEPERTAVDQPVRPRENGPQPAEPAVKVAKKQAQQKEVAEKQPERTAPAPQPAAEVSQEIRATVRAELLVLLDLMGFPAQVTVRSEQNSIVAVISGDHVDAIIGDEGKVLDSLQYLLRKILAKKHSINAALSLDAGDYRASRLQQLEALARKLAEEVRTGGKTRSISSLNPSERRVVHVVLQEDKDIRSRSVGDGLFKKVLIYRPGKGRKGGSGRRRKGGGRSGAPTESAE